MVEGLYELAKGNLSISAGQSGSPPELDSFPIAVFIGKSKATLFYIKPFSHKADTDNPKPCKYGDEKCIGKVIEFISHEKYAGDDSLNLGILDPIPIKKLHIKQGSDSPVNIDLLFTNNVGIGLKTTKISKITGFGKDLKTKHEITFKADTIALAGDYKISGKILILPISGSGKSKITMIEPVVKISWMGAPNVKNGETYMKLENFAIEAQPKSVKFALDNLFNDKALSDNMNKFLTDNWKEIYGEISGSLTRADDPKPCKYGETECIGKLFNYFVTEKHSGDKNYDLTSIDPLPIDKLVVSRGEDSPVNIKCVLTNADIRGVKTLRFEKIKGFGKEIAGIHEISGTSDYLTMSGHYNISGKVLILPIQGSGNVNFTMVKPKFRIGWTGVPYEKDGATYMKVQKFYIDVEPENILFFFENLYNNKELSDNMNKFLTENWQEIYPELKRPLTHGVTNEPQPCRFGDTECIGKVIEYLMSEKYDGDESMSLKQIDPLLLGTVRIQQGEDSPVNVDLILTNNSVHGWKTAKVVKVKGFDKDMTKKNQLIFKVDYLSLVGDYSIDGKILILPIKGKGQSNITMVDVTFQMDFVGTPLEKDGETYMTIKDMQLDAEPSQIVYIVENLFNGDKTLGDNMNLFLNENWKDLYQEVKASLADGFSKIYADVINDVFSKFPYEKFFAE
ncbi:uncharacterized protein LOC133326193 [Musca vetustissima]|uniref:uncharacterized protein LOC133326193 n=1 Tax=Musca vetustissima TaxID=27455 RepID=UPI002AB7DEA9|nr:uncharacterized protein LOC133326193 [Musca vetustissima]